jgi:hypothetical protein
MMPITHMSLPRPPRATIIQPRVKHVTFLALCLLAHSALAQQQSDSKPESKQGQDDLDVTMQIIVDPDAKLPDEVVRRIPLPERKSVDSPATNADKKASKDAAADSKQSAREAKELAKEASQGAKEEAAEQREQARRARAEERERERNHPPGNPNPPGRPPR